MRESERPDRTKQFECLVREYSQWVLTLALRLTGDAVLAQDVSQEVFASVWRAFPGQDGTHWPAYLRRATVREALRQVRARKETACEVPDPQTGPQASPENHAARAEIEAALQAALARLPEKQALAFSLTRLEGLSCRECAEVLGSSENAARVHLHRATIALRRMLKPFMPEESGRTPDRWQSGRENR